MSLTLSLLATNVFEGPSSRSTSASTTSDDTLHRHSCRVSSLRTLSLPLHENHPLPRHVQSSGNIAQSWKRPPLRTVQSQLPAPLHWEPKKPDPYITPVNNAHNPATKRCDSVGPAHEKTLVQASRHNFGSLHDSLESVSLGDEASPRNPFEDPTELAELEEDDPLLPRETWTPEHPPEFDPTPFKRWLSKLRRNGAHRKSDSHSTGVVSAVRTATMTIAESTIAVPRSWLGHRFGYARSSGSKQETCDAIVTSSGVILDEAAYSRSVQRRRILEELIESEENYLGDLKVLANVYFTLLASVCALSTHAKILVRENLTQLLQIHEDILGDLHSVVPHSEYNHAQAKETPAVHYKGHVRWHSADSGINKFKDFRLARRFRHSVDLARPPKQNVPGLTAEPRVAADAAKVFEKHMQSFFAYEEYGAKYDLMARDLASTYQTLGADDAFEKGIEVLSRTLDSMNIRSEHGKKGMTFSDLVIKPIQRMCRYPLLFGELLKHTPVSDGPEAHAQVEKVLYRLREATADINRATEDPSTRLLIEKTWLLQDKLVFPDNAHVSIKSRLIGHVLLCGVLHVAYQSRKGPQGQYMLCALFKSRLVLAIQQRGATMFDVVAIIPILNISIEEPDNGKGLQCHTASFTWKVVFQAGHRLFEFLFSACSPMEEEQWRKHLHQRNVMEDLDSSPGTRQSYDICESLILDLKPLATVYGHATTLARRVSIHRAATLVAKSHMHQVIIKHTESAEYSMYSSSTTSLPLARSKSIASAGHLPVLAPRRSERIHMEAAMSEIWTHELLPYPGMKSENPFKASANHMMRKLSMVSLSSSFSKRTSTFMSNSRPPRPDSRSRPRTPIEFAMDIGRRRSSRSPSKQPAKAVQVTKPVAMHSHSSTPAVNFHQNPDKFLPPDFELKDPRLNKPQRKKLTVRTMTDDGTEVAPPAKKNSYHRLQRSLSAKMPGMKEVAERFRPPTPQGPKADEEVENRPLKEVGPNKAVETVRIKKLRKLFS